MLDLFFRKYAWTASRLVLLFAAAWLTAKTVNTVVGVAIRPDPRAEIAAPPAPAPPRPSLPVALDTDALYRLIGQEPPRAAEEMFAGAAPTAPQNCDDPRAAPTKTDMRMSLVGGIVAERSRFSLATIADLNSRETHVLGIGDQVAGVRLLAVERVRDDRDATGNGFRVVAIVCNGGTKEYLDFEPGVGETPAGAGNLGYAPLPPRPTAPFPGGQPDAAGVQGVRRLADNRYEVDRSVVDGTLSDLNKIATQARIVPSFKNGVANGFKLFSIQPGSLYASIGIQNGDVIRRINGYEINSPDKAFELLSKLRDSKHQVYEFERAGQTLQTTVDVLP